MPFVSTAQQRFAFGTHQPWAERWARETNFANLPRRARAKLRRQARTKAMSRSEAARHAALVRWGKEQAIGDRRSAGAVRAATSEANRIRSAGAAAARAIRAAAGVNRALPKPKKGGGKKGGGKGAKPKAPKAPKQTAGQRAQARFAKAAAASLARQQRQQQSTARQQAADARRATLDAQRQADRQARLDRQAKLDARRERLDAQRAAKKPAASRGGSSNRTPAENSERDRIAAERLALAQQRFQAQQQRQAAQDAERQAQDAAVQKLENRQLLTPAEQLTLVRAGLARETRGRSGGAFTLTTAGQRRAAGKAAHDDDPDQSQFAGYTMEDWDDTKPDSWYKDARRLRAVVEKAGSPGDYLVVEDREKPSTWHLQVRRNGKPDHGLMGSAWAALHSGFRGNTYQGPNKTEAIAKLRALYAAEKMPVPSEKSHDEQASNPAYGLSRIERAPGGVPPHGAPALRRNSDSSIPPSTFAVYKDAAGHYRWVMQSSNAFRDRDREIVSTKALADDVARADQDRAYGPLRWWHVGMPFGPGLDIGDCDFNAMVGRVLIESGTFRTPAVGAAVAAKADQLQGSIGFVHPPNEPDADGVFLHIRRFERSLVPRGKAANPFTSLMVKELPMDEMKIKALAELLNIPAEQVQSLIVAPAQQTETKAIDAGVTFKAGDPIDPAQLAAALRDDPALLEATIKALEAAPVETKAEADVKADGMPDMEAPGEDMAEGGIEEPGDDNMLTDAECQKIATMTAQQVIADLMPHLGIGSKMDEVKSLLGSMAGGYAQKDAADAEQTKAIADLKAQQTLLNARLKELEGDAPAAIRAGFKASEAAATIVDPASPLAQSAPKADGLSDFLSTFVLGDLGAPAQP